ncbi:MAG: hypothetical protein AB2559_20280 [Candidatus Thiodiazotropha endolucinida]
MLNEDIAWLDGYLNALSSIDGGLRSYFATAFILESDNKSAASTLADFFKPEISLSISRVDEINDWHGYLEQALVDVLLKIPLGVQREDDLVSERRKYLAFRIMDSIGSMIESYEKSLLLDVEVTCINHESRCRFFLISCNEQYIVLQFTDENCI